MFPSKLGCPERKENNSLTSKCRFKNPEIHELRYVMELKTHASCVLASLIPGSSRQDRNEIEMDKK